MTVTKNNKLTTAEKRAWEGFRAAKKKAGVWPELKEVAAEMGITLQSVERLLKNLVVKGKLEKVGRYRGYRELKKTA